jgi:pimeloyl-ACP methyl ester carboxylesterase
VKVLLGDGRILRYWSSATDGPIVLFFHGCPDTRRIAMTGADAAREVGVRLLAFNRPGYGSSTPMASTHLSVARDAAELLDSWGIERVGVLGMSVGGPYAAAFAATYPERTTALALVSSPGPGKATEESVEDATERMRPEFLAWRAGIDPDDEDDAALAARFLAGLPESDADLLRTYDDEFLGSLVWEALVKPEGYLRDAALLLREWDFDPAGVRCPTTVWTGELDEKAVAASPWWHGVIPHADFRTAPDTTHLATLLTQWPAILRGLGADHGRGRG